MSPENLWSGGLPEPRPTLFRLPPTPTKVGRRKTEGRTKGEVGVWSGWCLGSSEKGLTGTDGRRKGPQETKWTQERETEGYR